MNKYAEAVGKIAFIIIMALAIKVLLQAYHQGNVAALVAAWGAFIIVAERIARWML